MTDTLPSKAKHTREASLPFHTTEIHMQMESYNSGVQEFLVYAVLTTLLKNQAAPSLPKSTFILKHRSITSLNSKPRVIKIIASLRSFMALSLDLISSIF
ncbi:hypothetical protein C4D60_Mb03t12870 [Musa balbisiana]|uniref:Uncharacterized protein n=1 Tax=Musa balbisiana TaxID=52838 RepID=A0A4S8J9K6_MUSBA|nr:hypothetical protein C4D60_Mb03t12870 [Musa balbisiana]